MPKRKHKTEAKGYPSSSEDEEGERDKLISALDPTLFGTSRENRNCSQQDKTSAMAEVNGMNGDLMRKSNRPKESDMEEEYSKPYSLDVTPEYQKFIAKKLTKVLERNIKDMPETIGNPAELDDVTISDGIYLMSSSKNRISDKDVARILNPKTKKQKKPKLRVTRHVDGSESEDEYSKLKHVAVTSEWVLNKNSL